MVVGLASVIIGTSLYQKLEGIGSISKALHNVRVGMVTFSVVIGSILYKACVAIALRMGLKSTDLKLITAVLFLVILVVSMERKGQEKCLNFPISINIIIRAQSMKCACFRILT